MTNYLLLTLSLLFIAVTCYGEQTTSTIQNHQNNSVKLPTKSIGSLALRSQTEVNLATPVTINSLASLFKTIAQANRSIGFHSLMTYEANGLITNYKLAHKIQNNTVEEQLIFMDGPRRQVLRHQQLHTCVNGETRRGLWPTHFSTDTLKAYSLKFSKPERIGDRETLVFEIIAKDKLRYSYQYSLDKQTGLLLRTVTYHKTVMLERLQTITIDFSYPDPTLNNSDEPDYLWRIPEARPCHTQQFESAWTVSWLPIGFISGGNRITTQGEQVLMFTDGLVSVSVFILNRDPKSFKKAATQHGATTLVISPSSSLPNKAIAIVGEIPIKTARQIAASVKPIK